MKYSAITIAKICQGKIIGDESISIREIVFDSRKVFIPNKSLFVALKTNKSDGHKFVSDVYQKGIRVFLVEKSLDLPKDSTQIIVKNTLIALQELASFHRSNFTGKIIGITGSNGKTIVKEWLSFVLAATKNVCKNTKSFNSQLGVPLSVLKLEENHDIGVFEAGISQPEEMSKLEKILKPSIGIFTNIGTAHDADFNSLEQKIEEKLSLFDVSKPLIYCSDDILIHQKIKDKQYKTPISWGKDEDDFIQIISKENSFITFKYKGEKHQFQLPYQNNATFINCMHVLTASLFLGLEMNLVLSKVEELPVIEMRLEVKKGLLNTVLINDYYNADVESISEAFYILKQHAKSRKTTVILSALTNASDEDYKLIASQLRQLNVDCFIGIGEGFNEVKHHFDSIKNTSFFVSINNFLDKFELNQLAENTILLKGERKYQFEQIEQKLSTKSNATRLEINLNAVANNLNVLWKKLPQNTKIMSMVKASAYGSSEHEVAQLLEHLGVHYFAVAITDEGVELRKKGILKPIMVLNSQEKDWSNLVQYKLEPEIFNADQLSQFCAFLDKKSIQNYPIHIKINTGMNRQGFDINELNVLVEKLLKNKAVLVKSIFSHLSAADEIQHDDFTLKQIHLFKKSIELFESIYGKVELKHILNSAGVLRFSAHAFDMVRLGIGLYGINPTSIKEDNLEVAMTLKSSITQVRIVSENDFIGYGLKGKLNESGKIAIVNIGYADGLRRNLSNKKWYFIVNNQQAPIIGNICMDLCMIDISHIKNVKIGDEVIVFGKENNIYQLSEKAETIPYEILTGISSRVNRVFLQE